MRLLLRSLLLALTALLTSCACFQFDEDEPLIAVPLLDVDRFMGRWHLIANVPYFAERGNIRVYSDFRRTGPMTLEQRFSAEREGRPRFVKVAEISLYDTGTFAEGRITYRPYPGQDFAVIYVDPQYRYAVIAHPTRNYGWVFSRTPEMPDKEYKKILSVMRKNGYDTSRVLKVPRTPEEAGTPGYQ